MVNADSALLHRVLYLWIVMHQCEFYFLSKRERLSGQCVHTDARTRTRLARPGQREDLR